MASDKRKIGLSEENSGDRVKQKRRTVRSVGWPTPNNWKKR